VSRAKFAWGAVVALAAGLFARLAFTVSSGRGPAFDLAIRAAVHSLASPPLTRTMQAITILGSEWFLIPFGIVVVWRLAASGRRGAAALLAASALGGEALTQILKLAFHRMRPQAFFGLTSPSNYSFPSGHSITVCCFWGVLAAILAARAKSAWSRAALWSSAILLAALVGFSRVYLGVHYPSDVLAGYAVAVVWVAALGAGYSAWLRR
jgi:undecaprenyl-diphosphatase